MVYCIDEAAQGNMAHPATHKGGGMRTITMIDGVALLAGIIGIAAGVAAGENDAAVAGKRGPLLSASS